MAKRKRNKTRKVQIYFVFINRECFEETQDLNKASLASGAGGYSEKQARRWMGLKRGYELPPSKYLALPKDLWAKIAVKPPPHKWPREFEIHEAIGKIKMWRPKNLEPPRPKKRFIEFIEQDSQKPKQLNLFD